MLEHTNTSNFPNFFIPGAAKSGTSTLHDLLNQHPDICMSNLKEPYYLVNDNFEDRIENYNAKYETLFKHKPKALYKGDSSTSYMLFPKFIESVKAHVTSDVKFIFILRNPIDRLYSHYWYLKGLGSETLDFRAAIENDKDIEPDMSKKLPEGKFKSYFQYGLYGKWLEKFYNNFNANQIKIILFEDLKEDPLKITNNCISFLELPPIEHLSDIKSNPTVILKYPKLYTSILRFTQGSMKSMKPLYKLVPRGLKTFIKKHTSNFIVKATKTSKTYPDLSLSDRKWAQKLYESDVERLKKITGNDFKPWKDFN